MSTSTLNNLIRMANQIAANTSAAGNDEAAAEMVANHLKKFWARSMKQEIVAYAISDGAELDPIAKLGVLKLSDQQAEQV